MNIKVLGSGCAKCNALLKNVKDAVQEMGIDAVIDKVEDVGTIVEYGVMSTPALVVDEKVVSSGKLLNIKEIKNILK